MKTLFKYAHTAVSRLANTKWLIAMIALALSSVSSSSAQEILVDSKVFNFSFICDKYDIDFTYKDNAKIIRELDLLFTDSMHVARIDSMSIRCTASPEAPYDYNMVLSGNRAKSIQKMLTSRYPLIEKMMFQSSHFVYKWSDVVDLIKADSIPMPEMNGALRILEDPQTTEGQKEYRIRHYGDRTAWRHIAKYYLTQLRHSDSEYRIYYRSLKSNIKPDMAMMQSQDLIAPRLSSPTYVSSPYVLYERKPILAFKTNLLYDAATALNISMEVPLCPRVSLAAEWIFPWWVYDNGKPNSARSRTQLLYGNLEARYWFGDRTDKEVMTGWFAGLYGGGGKYDFEYNKTGVQGEFISAGASFGFAHSINKKNTLRMEYSASLGYMKTNYRNYDAIYGGGVDDKWHPIRRSTGRQSYIGPTAVKVSFVWMLYYTRKVRGGIR